MRHKWSTLGLVSVRAVWLIDQSIDVSRSQTLKRIYGFGCTDMCKTVTCNIVLIALTFARIYAGAKSELNF